MDITKCTTFAIYMFLLLSITAGVDSKNRRRKRGMLHKLLKRQAMPFRPFPPSPVALPEIHPGGNADFDDADVSDDDGLGGTAHFGKKSVRVKLMGDGLDPDRKAYDTPLGSIPVGDQCEYCVEDAECVGYRCVCRDGFEGDPLFYCVNSTENIYCHSKADPAIRTLGEENYVVHVVGSTRLAQLTTERESGGFCRFWLWGWTERVKGKQYFGGLSFRLDQEDPSGLVDVRRGHIQATGREGEPYEWSVTYYGPGEPFAASDTFEESHAEPEPQPFVGYLIGGCDLEVTRISEDFKKFSIPCCGIEFAIRPFHHDHPEVIPGWWLQVRQDVYPSYETWDENEMHTEPLCLDHYRMFLVEDLVESTGVTIGKREALSYHAETNSLFTEQPNAPEGLAVLKILLRDCPYSKRDELMRAIRFFFNNPRFTKCLNGATGHSVETTIEGMQLASELMCYDVDDGCEPLATMVSRPECANVLRDFPEIKDYLVYPTECTGGIHNDFLDTFNPYGGFWFDEDIFGK